MADQPETIPADETAPRVLRVPWFNQNPVGLGDAVAKVTTALGIRPCGDCKRRQSAMNKRVQIGGPAPEGERSPEAQAPGAASRTRRGGRRRRRA